MEILSSKKPPDSSVRGALLLFNEIPAKPFDFCEYESLLSSRLYCRYRNSLCAESHRFSRFTRVADYTAGWDFHPTPKINHFFCILI